jgi:hypothetical protein
MNRSVLAFPKPVRLEDPDYLRFIRRQPCVVSHTASQAAHIKPEGHGKMGSKVSDYRTVPLSWKLHEELDHKLGRERFEEKYNVDLDKEQIRLLEMYVSALREGENLGARQ